VSGEGPAPAGTQAPPSPPRAEESDSLPAGLWIGTFVFALLAAGALAVSIHLGRSVIVDSANKQIEKAAVESKDRPPEAAPAQPATQAQADAAQLWRAGIVAYQKGDVAGARDYWTRCQQADPSSENCATGLAKLDAPAPAAQPASNPYSRNRVR
jgi:hypothetical protein